MTRNAKGPCTLAFRLCTKARGGKPRARQGFPIVPPRSARWCSWRTPTRPNRPTISVTMPASSAHKQDTPEKLPREITAPRDIIEAALAQTLESLTLPAALRQAMLYATLGNGKRLRPLLCWHACRAAGGQGPESLPACIAIELVHCFSLVHDDLPALDDDDLRRGKATLHVEAGEAMAILAGDALLNCAYKTLTNAASLDAQTIALLTSELARACEGMIAGQVLDTLGYGTDPQAAQMSEKDKLETIHLGKTGAMLIASVRMGAICAPAFEPARLKTDPTLAALTTYGQAVGLSFQIVDDVLDVTQTAAHLGKRTGKDAEAGKRTYPGVMGLDASRARVGELEAEALDALKPFGSNGDALRTICTYLTGRTR